jgi:hypothetical protein
MHSSTQKGKYSEYLNKIEEVSTELENDMNLRTIKLRVQDIFMDLSNKEEIRLHQTLFKMLAIPAAVIFLIHLIFFKGLISLAGIIILFLYIRHHNKLIRSKTAEIKKQNFHPADQEVKNIPDLITTIQYLMLGADLKISRVNSVRWFYVILFPIIMVSSMQFFIRQTSFNELIRNLIIAGIFGGAFWFYHFYQDIQKYEGEAEELEEYLDKLAQY